MYEGDSIDNDPVVHEVDVYIKHALGKLILAQYPLRPTYKAYQNTARKNLKMKPIKNEMEVEMHMSTGTSTPERVQKLAVKQKPLIKPNTAAGLLKGHNLYLTPLESIVKLTPSFQHIDDQAAEDAKLNEKVDSGVQEIKAVTRRFSSQTAKVETPEKKEMWTPCDYREPEHPYSAGQKRSIIGKGSTDGVKGAELSKTEYLLRLLPEEADVVYVAPPLPSTVTGFGELRKLPPPKQVETILRNAKVISYKEISQFLPSIPTEQVLTALQEHAYLVQGHWVVNSKVIYPEGSKSSLTGVPAEVMQRHRDFIMWAFFRHPTIKRENLMKIMKIPPEEVVEILQQVSVLKAYNGWTFKKEYDPEFDYNHQSIMISEKRKWDQLYDALHVSLHLKNHKQNELLRFRVELETSCSVNPLISEEKATEIITRLNLMESIDATSLADMTIVIQEHIREASCRRDDVITLMSQFVPYDQCSLLLHEMTEEMGLLVCGVIDKDGSTVPVICFKEPGCTSDKFRPTLLQLFSSNYKVSKAMMKEAIQKELDCSFTHKDYQTLTGNMCTNAGKATSWILKLNDIPDIVRL